MRMWALAASPAHQRLDALSDRIAEDEGDSDATGQKSERRDATILGSLPGVGTEIYMARSSAAQRTLGDEARAPLPGEI